MIWSIDPISFWFDSLIWCSNNMSVWMQGDRGSQLFPCREPFAVHVYKFLTGQTFTENWCESLSSWTVVNRGDRVNHICIAMRFGDLIHQSHQHLIDLMHQGHQHSYSIWWFSLSITPVLNIWTRPGPVWVWAKFSGSGHGSGLQSIFLGSGWVWG